MVQRARERARLQLVVANPIRASEAPGPSDASGARESPAAIPPPLLDDAEILAAVRRGDRNAATSLYRRARPQVDATLGRLLGRASGEHDDLVQLSMIALVGSIARFRGDCSLDTWIARITAHVAFKEVRRRKAERTHAEEARAHAVRVTAPSADEPVAARGMIERVRMHLDAMDPVKAWTVVLHDVCGYDLREIAEITSASVAAAQTRLVRGRTELHHRIEADPELAERLEQRGDRRRPEGT